MEKLRIEKRDIYTIEVNDNGETIEFDLLDIELPYKLERAYKRVNEVSKDLKGKLIIIEKKADKMKKGSLLSSHEQAILDAYRDAFKEMRKAVDEFLGENACQKIFGDRNYLEMFDELFIALEPHFEKMKLNKDGITERITKKYAPKDEGVLK